MSIKLKTCKLTTNTTDKLDSLKLKIVNKYNPNFSKYVFPVELINDCVFIPFAYASTEIKLHRPKRHNFGIIEAEFAGQLRSEQELVKSEAISILNKTGSVLLSMYCGFGKTITSINLAAHIKMKTLIIVNKLVLITQWEKSIEIFSEYQVQLNNKN